LLLIKRFAPGIFVLLWSTGFVGAKYILPYASPFTFLAIRYFFATIILVALAKLANETLRISKAQIKESVLVSVFLHVLYIAGVFYAVHLGVSAGIAAVIVSLQPIFVSLIAIPMFGEKLRVVQIAGLLLGLIGVALLLLPRVFKGDYSSSFSALGLFSCFLALVGTTVGYLLQKRTGSGIPFLSGTAVQYAAATAIYFVLAVIFEDTTVIVNLRFILALTWIVMALSIGSIFLLFFMLRTDSASTVSSLYYLVPPLAAIQAYILFGERIGLIGILGMGLAALGVLLVTKEQKG
jgi:drug/metabolite transporter (DMT)-like permease